MKKSAPINFAPRENFLRACKLLRPWLISVAIVAGPFAPSNSLADREVKLTGVPDYDWQYGCFGTASGNLMGYWDRHGFPDFYTGLAGGGVAPLYNQAGNDFRILSMWASRAGLDGRATNQPGHIDDYYIGYESTGSDPYLVSHRTEHTPDSIGDFIGLSQKHYTNQNDECDGNIDGFSFVFWDTNGLKRVNFIPPTQGTNAGRDIPSGLRAWTRYRGYDAEAFSQLVDFNPNCPPGQGFTFADLQAEIDAGYPVLVFLQSYSELYRPVAPMLKANPHIHGMLIYGYLAYEGFGTNVYCRTSWASGDDITHNWSTMPWMTDGNVSLSVRGVIGYHPKPKIRSLALAGANVTITWDGPASQLYDMLTGSTTPLHRYQLERSLTLEPPDFQPVGPTTTNLNITVPECCAHAAYFRVQLLPP